MPRKITLVNELTDNAAAMAQHRCELCGAELGSEPEETAIEKRIALETIHALAVLMKDDWRACCVFLYYIADPTCPLQWLADKLGISKASAHNARERALVQLHEMAGIVGKRTRRSIAQRHRFDAANQQPHCIQGDVFEYAGVHIEPSKPQTRKEMEDCFSTIKKEQKK